MTAFLTTMKAIAWSFFGVRKGRDLDKDAGSLNPIHVVIAGILAGVLFVLTLRTVVYFVLK